MMMLFKKVSGLFVLLSLFSCAHYGHDHNPGLVKPKFGGQLIKGKDYYIEVVGNKEIVEIYPSTYDPNSRIIMPISSNEIDLTVSYHVPQKSAGSRKARQPGNEINRSVDLPLTYVENHFVGKFEKTLNKYHLHVEVDYLNEKEEFEFVIDKK